MTAKAEARLEATTKATGGARVRTHDTVETGVEVSLPSIGADLGAALASSCLTVGKGSNKSYGE